MSDDAEQARRVLVARTINRLASTEAGQTALIDAVVNAIAGTTTPLVDLVAEEQATVRHDLEALAAVELGG